MNAKNPQLAVFASGSGTNLQAILDEIQKGTVPAVVRLVLSDKKDAFALERARKVNVETLHISPKTFKSREEYDRHLVGLLRERKIEWVILAGFMRILSPEFVRPFSGKILNIHPAMLPNYPGTHAIERAFKAGEKQVGVTVHFVDEGVDTGPIIVQEGVAVKPDDTLESITERVHALEHKLYPQAIRKVLLKR